MSMKWIACSIVLALLAGPSAFGITIQNQVFNVGSVNGIDLTQGIQNAASTQNLTIDLSQIGSGSGLSMANVSLLSVTGQMGVLLPAAPLAGTGIVGLHPIVGTTGLMLPLGSLGSLQMAQMRAGLIGQLLAN